MKKCAAACEHYGSAYEKKGSYQDIIYKSDSVPGNLIYELLVVVGCLLYTSDAADDLLCVDLGGRRIIQKKTPPPPPPTPQLTWHTH